VGLAFHGWYVLKVWFLFDICIFMVAIPTWVAADGDLIDFPMAFAQLELGESIIHGAVVIRLDDVRTLCPCHRCNALIMKVGPYLS